jgi:hypothetical protein
MAEFETLFLSGIRADQPAASAADQKFYQVEDEGNIIERSDGVTWASWGPTGSGSMQFIQTKVVSGGAVQDIDFDTALDGDVDKIYLIEGYVVSGNNSVDADLTLQPNSVSTGQTCNLIGPGSSSNLLLCNIANGNSTKFGHFSVKFWAESGRIRTCSIFGGSHGNSGDNDNFFGNGTWTDTATNITNFNFHSANATGIGNGSTFSIYRVVNA